MCGWVLLWLGSFQSRKMERCWKKVFSSVMTFIFCRWWWECWERCVVWWSKYSSQKTRTTFHTLCPYLLSTFLISMYEGGILTTLNMYNVKQTTLPNLCKLGGLFVGVHIQTHAKLHVQPCILCNQDLAFKRVLVRKPQNLMWNVIVEHTYIIWTKLTTCLKGINEGSKTEENGSSWKHWNTCFRRFHSSLYVRWKYFLWRKADIFVCSVWYGKQQLWFNYTRRILIQYKVTIEYKFSNT